MFNVKGKIKANTVDKYLHPIRQQILALVAPNTKVVEFGCGNGDLLCTLSGKVQAGIGIDKSAELIAYASDRANKKGIKNLDFKVMDLVNETYSEPETDYSLASLLFHILPWMKALEVSKEMIAMSKTTIICGFSRPENVKQKALLWLDQRFTGHYSNFRDYAENGFTEGLLHAIEDIEFRKIDTFDPVIKIYTITKNSSA